MEHMKKKLAKQEKEKHSFTGKMKAFFGSSSHEEKQIEVSGPQGFKHEMAFNAETGEMDIEKLPPELVEVFKKAGITKKDL